ncbi:MULTISPECIES: hypothetical protein [Limosilactobacillus]|nr:MULTISPECIES: hypothetical protein [Limosilactobacillus]MCT3188247.1 hypothetical protein [Limosilactobacillus reuteri]MCT3198116.1 hypothetical protein [Limosilactobacillus reuteri]
MTLDEILNSTKFPDEVTRNQVFETVNSLDEDGKEALLAYQDESSEFFQNAQPELLAKRFLAEPNKYPQLFHYTTSSSLKSILETKTFLAGSISEMNDSEEIKHTYDLCVSILNSLGASENEIHEFAIQFVFTMIHFDTYLWCFTGNGDSMAMGRYGDTVLKFDNQDIQNVVSNEFTPLNFANGYLKSGDAFVFPLVVNYNQKFQRQYLLPIVKVVLACIKNMNVDLKDMNEILQNSMHSLYLLSLCFKRPEIWEEREIRFVILRLVKDGKTQEDIVLKNKHKIKIGLDESILKQVILDRNWTNKMSKMREILNKYGFVSTDLRLTKIPY